MLSCSSLPFSSSGFKYRRAATLLRVEYRQQDGWDAGIPQNAIVIDGWDKSLAFGQSEHGGSFFSAECGSTQSEFAWSYFARPDSCAVRPSPRHPAYQISANSIDARSGTAMVTIGRITSRGSSDTAR
jgi:hypothetical protein